MYFISCIESHRHQIFQACLRIFFLTSGWKVARAITIPKSDKNDYSVASTFRPISLLSDLGKLLERLISARLQHQARSKCWLNEIQHRFYVQKSTVTAVSSSVRQINHGYGMKAHTVCVLLDLRGAFDNASHDLIITDKKRKHCPRYLIL